MKPGFSLIFLAALLAAPAADATLSVEGAVSPAWVERAGSTDRVPLEVGMTLQNQDRVVTGFGSRALLRLADGSAVKLGENAVVNLDGLAETQNDRARKLVTASLDVARGAFRFTTGIFSRRAFERDVRIRVATVTAGIRGTDIWGKSDDRRDLVCLIEGKVEVTRGTDAPVALDQPLDFYVAPKDGSAPVKAKVDQRQLDQWAAETELGAVAGGSRRGGRFRVEVSTAPDQQAALRDYDAVRRAGYPAVIQPVKSDAAVEYRVRIVNLLSERDAQSVAEKVKALGLAGATVGK
jgi:hypothetical protein